MPDAWIVCAHCRLRHRSRDDGLCPRCRGDARGSARPEAASPAAATSAPPDPARPRPGVPWRPLAISGAALLALAIAGVALLVWRSLAREDDPTPSVATFAHGQITRRDIEREVASLPPGCKANNSNWLWYLARGLVVRRALAREALFHGHFTLRRGADGERELVQKLIRGRLPTPRSLEEAQEHARQFDALAARAIGPPPLIHLDVLDRIEFDPMAPVTAPEEPFPGPPVPYYFMPADAVITHSRGIIDPGRRWYRGTGASVPDFDPVQMVWMEAVYGPPQGFLHVFVNDGTPRTEYDPLRRGPGMEQYLIDNEAYLPDMPEDLPARFHLGVADVAAPAGIDPEAARRWYARVQAPFEFCEAHYYSNVATTERTATFTLSLELQDGAVRDGTITVDGLPAPGKQQIAMTMRRGGLDPSGCLLPFQTYRLAGTGTLRYTLRLTVDDPAK